MCARTTTFTFVQAGRASYGMTIRDSRLATYVTIEKYVQLSRVEDPRKTWEDWISRFRICLASHEFYLTSCFEVHLINCQYALMFVANVFMFAEFVFCFVLIVLCVFIF